MANNAQNTIFSTKETTNFVAFSCTLKRIHTRLIREGYEVKNGRVFKPSKKLNNVKVKA